MIFSREMEVYLMALTSISVKIDKELKAEADRLFVALGIPISTAINMFIRQAVQRQAIPFEIKLDANSQGTALIKDMSAQPELQSNAADEPVIAINEAERNEERHSQENIDGNHLETGLNDNRSNADNQKLTSEQKIIAKSFLLAVHELQKKGFSPEDDLAFDELRSGKFKPVFEERV